MLTLHLLTTEHYVDINPKRLHMCILRNPENKLSYNELFDDFCKLAKLSTQTHYNYENDINIITRSGVYFYNMHSVLKKIENLHKIYLYVDNKPNKIFWKCSNNIEFYDMMQYDHFMIHNHVKHDMIRDIRPGYKLDGSVSKELALFKLLEGKKTNV